MNELVYPRVLLPTVERWADRVAVHDGGHRATFSEHVERVLRLGSALRTGLGLQPRDRIAVMAGNGHVYLELYHAAFCGATLLNPLNLRLSPVELSFVLRDSGARVVFVDALFAEVVDSVRRDAGIEHVVLVGEGDVPHDVRYEELLASGEPVVPPEPDERDPVIVMYTGGTTGVPKGVVLDQRAEMLNVYHVGIAMGFDEDWVYLHQTPMFHAASMPGVLGIPATGATSVFVAYFEPAAVMEAIEQHHVDTTLMVPVMIAMLLAHPEFRPERLASLRTLVYGAAPMPAGLLDRVLELFPHLELYQGYGMTEAAAVLTMLTPRDHRGPSHVASSVGRPVFGVALAIRDAQDGDVPPGTAGEVCVRAGNLMQEYWNRPDETAEAFRGGWYHTGDVGYLDADGFLHLVDRVKDMIVSGGENVYSVEVESAISTHPAVAQVAVIGIPHDLWGEAVHAIVVPRVGEQVTAEEIIEHARRTIAGYKVPKTVELRSEPLPLSGALKPLKRELRRPYWEGRRGISAPAGEP